MPHIFSGIGAIPAVFDSLTELKLIRENEDIMMDGQDFFIGGKTNAAGGENIEYFEYLKTSAGKNISKRLNIKHINIKHIIILLGTHSDHKIHFQVEV